MTDKKWNKEEYTAYKSQFLPDEKEQKRLAIECQKTMIDNCSDPIQKKRYEKGLEILLRREP